MNLQDPGFGTLTAVRTGRTAIILKRATVTLSGLETAEALQLNMLHQTPNFELQSIVDEVNGPLNLAALLIVLAGELTGKDRIQLRREMLSKCPTTNWDGWIEIKAG